MISYNSVDTERESTLENPTYISRVLDDAQIVSEPPNSSSSNGHGTLEQNVNSQPLTDTNFVGDLLKGISG